MGHDDSMTTTTDERPTTVPTPAVRTGARWRFSGARVFTYTVVTMLAAAIIIPVVWVVGASLKEQREFYDSPWALPQGASWSNYVDAFVEARMGAYFLNSVIVTALALVLVLLFAVPAAYVMARYTFRGRGIIQAILMAGLFINVNYIVVPIFLLLNDGDGWLRDITGDSGWLGAQLAAGSFLLDNRLMLAVVYAATTIPFTVYLLSNFLSTIPADYEEAATLDGASRLRVMMGIILPMAKPAITTVVLFNFLTYWNDFIIALTLLPSEGNRTLQVGLLNLMTAQRAAADYGRLYAGMVIVMVPVLIFYAVIQKRLISGIAGGGVKG